MGVIRALHFPHLPSQTVPPLPLLWWDVRATLPCKPQPSEKPRCETEKAAPRAWPVRSRYVGTCVSPLQSAEGPKDVNKVMARFALDDELLFLALRKEVL